MTTIGIAFIVIGILGFILGLALHVYGAFKHDSGWLITAQQTSLRGIFVFIIGLLIYVFSK